MIEFPRIRYLRDWEKEAFLIFLEGKTRPFLEGEPPEDQDGFFPEDYREWKETWTGN